MTPKCLGGFFLGLWMVAGSAQAELPTAFTGPRREAGADAVELQGSYNTSEPGRVWMAWGEEGLDRQTEILDVAAGNGAFRPVARGFEAGKTYRYAMVAENGSGRVIGETREFRKRGQAGHAVNVDFGAAYWFWTERDQREFFPTQTITMEMWVRPTTHGVAISERDLASPSVKQNALVELLPNGELMARVVGLEAIAIGRLELNVWSHIAVRYDAATEELCGWVNGVKSPNVGVGQRLEGHEWPRALGYFFGRGLPNGMIGTGEPMHGHYDEVRFWNVARSDEEIARDYTRILYGTEAGLRAYYRCDVRRALTLTDHSGNANGGRVEGAGDAVSGARVGAHVTPMEMLGDVARLQFVGTAGREMRLQFTRDFVTWENGPAVMPDALGVGTFEVARVEGDFIFYRAEPGWVLEAAQF